MLSKEKSHWLNAGKKLRGTAFLFISMIILQVVIVGAAFSQQAYIPGVPDTNQPPTNTIGLGNISNFCAPVSAANVTGYWDGVKNHANAVNVNAGIVNLKTVAEYIGWFMDTNNCGTANRGNGNDGHLGTYTQDIAPGILDFVSWNGAANTPPGAPALPAGSTKNAYRWQVKSLFNPPGGSWNHFMGEINAGRPPVLCFNFWNPGYLFCSDTIGTASQDSVYFYDWGDSVSSSSDPEEVWYGDVGHAVTGVGYYQNYDPDGRGPAPAANWVVVHDNWGSTPKNVAIPWANWKCTTEIDPSRPLIAIGIWPIRPDPQVYTIGEMMASDVQISNTGEEPVEINAWMNAVLPNGLVYGPLVGPACLRLEAGDVIDYFFFREIPWTAPPGDYYLELRVGEFYSDEDYLMSAGFTFEVIH